MVTPPLTSKPALGGLCVLKTRAQFLYVRGGQKAGRPSVLIEARPVSDADIACDGQMASQIAFGVTATRKLGNAVVRNRAKRRMRHAAQLLLPVYGQPGWAYVLVARAAIQTHSWTALLDDIKATLIRLRPQRLPPPSQS